MNTTCQQDVILALQIKHNEIGKKMDPIRERLDTYDEERQRGIAHTSKYKSKMVVMRRKLRKLEKECVKACDAYNNARWGRNV